MSTVIAASCAETVLYRLGIWTRRLPPIGAAISGIIYSPLQSLAQLKERYENPEKLLSNCASTLYLGSVELQLLAELEAKLGKTRITPDGSEKPLCSQAELMTLEKARDHKEAI